MKSRSFNLLVILALFLSLLGSALTITPTRAASIVVDSNADTIANDGTCTLREAITNANNDNTSGSTDCAAGAGADTITFSADYTITLTSQLPAITSVITITGNVEANTIIQASACNPVTLPGGCTPATYRVLRVATTGNLTLNGLTIQHGRCVGACETLANIGGGILNQGVMTISNVNLSGNRASVGGGGMASSNSLTLTNVTFSDNLAGNNGGGINNTGSLSLTNVTFSGNQATNGGGMYNIGSSSPTLTNVTFNSNSASTNGGGIYNNSTGTLTITGSTLSSNTANTDGGGIYNHISGTVTVTNSTLSGNTAAVNGGGIYNYTSGTLTVTNSTLSGNSAIGGGGIFNAGTLTVTNSTFNANSATIVGGLVNDGTATITNSTFNGNSASDPGGVGGIYNNLGGLNLLNTIIANSTNGDCINSFGSIGIEKNNLITGFYHEACDIVDGANGSITGSAANLDALADNGGPTQTIALLSGSPAIDAGDAATCAAPPVSGKDQRGVTRPQGAGCDIGAYEFGAEIPVVTASNPSANAVLTSLSSITVVFNQDVLNDGSAKAANNTVNYILVERGVNGSFDTLSCNGGVVSDDVQQTISTASYNSAGFITSLTLASPLTAGTYRLFVCGTTSIWSAAGLELNNGANDTTVDFTIAPAAGTGSPAETTNTSASALPKTGFAPNKVTSLTPQPANLEYAKLGDLWLEIPSLSVKSTIVGVPQNADKTWDVSWLGNDTGWLNGTAFPTWTGNSVLTAHVTNADGLEGPFAALKSLKYGDQIIVHMGGVKYIYEVRVTKLARPYSTSFAFESKQDASYLTLVTCSGYNPLNESYIFRRVVRAVLVSTVSE